MLAGGLQELLAKRFFAAIFLELFPLPMSFPKFRACGLLEGATLPPGSDSCQHWSSVDAVVATVLLWDMQRPSQCTEAAMLASVPGLAESLFAKKC